MIKKLITTTGLTLLAVCSTAMCADVNYMIANTTGGTLSISPQICYYYYVSPEKDNLSMTCDSTQTGVAITPIKTANVQISIGAPDLPKKAADPTQGNYGWVTDLSSELIVPGSTAQAVGTDGTTAFPVSDWGDDSNCQVNIQATSAYNTVLYFDAAGTWLTYRYEG